MNEEKARYFLAIKESERARTMSGEWSYLFDGAIRAALLLFGVGFLAGAWLIKAFT